MGKRILIQLIWNRWTFLALVWLIIQQLIVASSTAWIARLSYAVTSQQPFWIDLTLFVTSLVVVYIPAIISIAYLDKAKFISLHNYINSFLSIFKNKVTLWGSQNLRENKTAFLSSESYLVLNDSMGFLYDWGATSLNVLFNILIFGYVVDRSFLAAYVISIILMMALIYFFKGHLHASARNAQEKRISLTQGLLLGWDNIIISNKYNLNFWQEIVDRRFREALNKSLFSVKLTQIVAASTMILAMAPVIGLMIYLFSTHITNLPYLAMLVATLPRQIQILQHLHIVVSYTASWNVQKARLQGLSNAVLIDENELNPEKRINWNQLLLVVNSQEKSVDNFHTILKEIQTNPKSRLTLRGSNGSGKSTLLYMIKQHYGDDAFYLPAHSNLVFQGEGFSEKSTGQKTSSALQEIICNVKTPLILLDEWDANLDRLNISTLGELIDQLAATSCVLEVRHH